MSPHSDVDEIHEALTILNEVSPPLRRHCQYSFCFTMGITMSAYVYCTLQHGGCIGWIVFCAAIQYLSMLFMDRCFIAFVRLVHEEREALIQTYHSQRERICMEQEEVAAVAAVGAAEDFVDDDDGSYTYTSETEGMTTCCSFVDDSSFWECGDNDCDGIDVTEPCCGNHLCSQDNTVILENLEMVGQCSS